MHRVNIYEHLDSTVIVMPHSLDGVRSASLLEDGDGAYRLFLDNQAGRKGLQQWRLAVMDLEAARNARDDGASAAPGDDANAARDDVVEDDEDQQMDLDEERFEEMFNSLQESPRPPSLAPAIDLSKRLPPRPWK